jgi:hypothetical protein
MSGMISKKDAFRMTPQQVTAGKRMWARTAAMAQRGQGRFAASSMDAEANAPRTWIMWVNGKGEEIHTLECELYPQARYSDPNEAVAMLVIMCPKCAENLLVREEVRYAPKHIQINYRHRMERERFMPWTPSDKVPVISCPERWLCDYCKGWCVRVSAGIATTDMSGATQITVHGRPTIIGEKKNHHEGGGSRDL